MKNILLTAILAMITAPAFAGVVIDLSIIKSIESSGNPLAYNKRTQATGLYQITPIVVKEFNQFNKTNYKIADMFVPMIAEKVASWYMMKRIPQMLKHYGVKDSVENRIIAWNAGISYAIQGHIPRETKNFIQKYWRLKNG